MAFYINDKNTGDKKLIAGQSPVDNKLNENSNNAIANSVVAKEINELKKSVSDGKNKLAGAITAKGVATEATETFDVMAKNIRSIQTGVNAYEVTYYAPIIIADSYSVSHKEVTQ